MRIINISGNNYERGFRHGNILHKEILSFFEKHCCIENGDPNQDWKNYVKFIVEKTKLIEIATKWVPNVIEEIQGIAESTSIPFEELFIMQLLDENGWLKPKFERRLDFKEEGDNFCSTIGVMNDSPSPHFLGQNADNGKFLNGNQILFHIVDPNLDLESFILSYPGLIGIYGMNNYGIGVCLNAMSGQMQKSTSGLGTLFIMRGILNQKTIENAINFLHDVPHASGETYSIGSRKKIVSYECSPNQIVEFKPRSPKKKIIYHTNHPIFNNDNDKDYIETIKASSPEMNYLIEESFKNTYSRYETLENRLFDLNPPYSSSELIEILRSHEHKYYPVCRHESSTNNAMTNFSFMMEFGMELSLKVADGPPCSTKFHDFYFAQQKNSNKLTRD